ncbi:Na+/H+ antiporter NhaA [Diaphorobacter aerolatus]|uniref:Na(+)/H(+) antiporter NhaA n=1 Tax=Diaphorobacter aerolatus TaxID=1288495 RepID=A0A7H0GHA1_9BURK|nr:Na+/H+ antiporter NhaA [Diaphorobacter aerolatus]QNP47667.1 Na+/H+ antiporter NhaA [Diaphorobacter aerolatus]
MTQTSSHCGPAAPLSFAHRCTARIARLIHSDAAGGVMLLLAAAAALAWANSPAQDSYHALWHATLGVSLGAWEFVQSAHFWVNDVLMTVFFLVVGMEIRRELHSGALAEPRQALLPMMAALGGVAVPALVYVALVPAGELLRGWAIPTATDIAFAVGVLALLGRGMPPALRVFLLTLAIIDDLIAVLIIALFYSGGLQWSMLLIAALGLLGVFCMQALGIRRAWFYVLPGAVLWWGIWQTGAHPTLAGVVLGLVTPVQMLQGRESAAPVDRVACSLHPWVTFGIMPLFALANAGVTLQSAPSNALDASSAVVTAAIAAALLLGKPAGVMLMSWLAVQSRLCALPPHMRWSHMLLAGLLSGIGFTMSIFIGTLAFADAALLNAAKLGVLAASASAAIAGLIWGLRIKGARRC